MRRHGERRLGGLRLKRALDIVVALLALGALWPVMLIAAFAIRVTFGPPVLFRQTRPGLAGRAFEMWKFRSMRDVFDDTGRQHPDEQRLGSLGRFLRATSFDELPELWNVLRGDMSLVGPRPLLMEYLPLYSPEQARRHEMRPGITGWAQVNGRNAIAWEQKFAYDVWYVDHWSLALDLKILGMTLINVLRAKGVSQEGHATMQRFRGGAQ